MCDVCVCVCVCVCECLAIFVGAELVLSPRSPHCYWRYDGCKRRARQENIKDLVDLQCLYRAGEVWCGVVSV